MVKNLMPSAAGSSIDSFFSDEFVVIKLAKNGNPSLITVSCPDQLGLACDLARCILDFGLDVTRADFCTDVRWCYMLFWVTPALGSRIIEWDRLKKRLASACPSASPALFPPLVPMSKINTGIYILQSCSADQIGLLNGMVQKLWDLEVDVQKINILTCPDGTAVGIFCITNSRCALHTRRRKKAICDDIKSVAGTSSTFCEIIRGSEDDLDTCSELDMYPTIPPDLLSDAYTSSETGQNPVMGTPVLSISIDNSISAAHTLLRIEYQFRRGLLYDCIRVIKDHNLQIAYGRLSIAEKGKADLDLFVLQANGSKLCDLDKQNSLLSRLRVDICNPIRVMVIDRGIHAELLVATTVEKTGRGRPRVLHDVTLVLKMLEICIFKADIVKLSHRDRLWEVYRFLLVEKPNANSRTNSHIVERVLSVLMG